MLPLPITLNTTTLQVVILVGGLGTRLGPLTRNRPKPLVEVAGRPYLEWQIALLRRHGFERFLLLTSYLADQIEDYFGDGRRCRVSISCCRQPTPAGTAQALQLAVDQLEQQFLLMNGDTLVPMDYGALVQAAALTPTQAWMVATPRAAIGAARGNLRLDPSGQRVIEYVRGGREDIDFVHAGIFVLARAMVPETAVEQGSSIESAFCPTWAATVGIRACVWRGHFYDMGTPRQLDELEQFLRQQPTTESHT